MLLHGPLLVELAAFPWQFVAAATVVLLGALTLVASISSYLKYRSDLKSKSTRLPPGPPTVPWFGSIGAVRGINKSPRETCRGLTQYGEMATVWLGSWPSLVVNSPRVAHDLMQKGSASSTDRPMNNDFRAKVLPWSLVLAPVGKQFQHLRRIYHSVLSQTNATIFKQYDEDESAFLLQRLVEVPEEAHFECDRYSFNIMMRALYGVRCGTEQDAVVTETYDMWKEMYWYFIPGSLPFDIFPNILNLPSWLQPWNWTLDRLKKRERRLHVENLERIKKIIALDEHHNQANFAAHLLRRMKVEKLTDQAVVDICGMLLGAGSDTIGGILQQFFKAMALHPQVVATAQKEIDAVVGHSRMPTWEDEQRLPYVRALIKEVHRWCPIAVVGIPHATTEDMHYEGYMIPKGTILIPNIPSLMRSPQRYANPDAFQPERFLQDLGDSAESAHKADWAQRDHVHFGWGRRFCPGIYVGEAALYLAISRILWGFNISPAPGVPVIMEAENDGLLKKPLPFRLNITSRGLSYRTLIAQDVQARSLGRLACA